jgi:hypothetical protein
MSGVAVAAGCGATRGDGTEAGCAMAAMAGVLLARISLE